jgi:hypothetical protein
MIYSRSRQVQLHLYFLNVPLCPQLDLGILVICNDANRPTWIPVNKYSRWNTRSLGHEGLRVNNGARADRRSIKHGTANRDARDAFHLAAVDDAAMGDRDIIAYLDLEIVG